MKDMTPAMRKRLNDRERVAHKMEVVAHELAQCADILLELGDPDYKAAKQNSEAASKFAGKLQGKYSAVFKKYSNMLSK